MIEKLKLEVYTNINFEGEPVRQMSLQVNPEDFKEEKSISYEAKGDAPPQYKDYAQEKLSFNFTIDGTGVIPIEDKNQDFVYSKVSELEKYLYAPFEDSDEKRQPYYVLVRWGRLFFKGRLRTMNVHYTLFKPSGEPLRAKVSLTFVKVIHIEGKESKAQVNKEEKDKIVVVKSGDTLPYLCQREYGDSTLVEKVARNNDLDDFRELKEGQRLRFAKLT
ncbi:hypothetical protein LJC52_02865 [Bacteroidales bacterium OttesenSCG-928-A17]|nr:hypothetical protein [Bacteroidales bacterium OttesenSCG-928-A17]